ncbi:hypothetical protein C8Q77DRAFT_1144393, partial [Trametes polyzona]
TALANMQAQLPDILLVHIVCAVCTCMDVDGCEHFCPLYFELQKTHRVIMARPTLPVRQNHPDSGGIRTLELPMRG